MTSFFTAVNDKLPLSSGSLQLKAQCTVLVKEIFSWFSESNEAGNSFGPFD